MHPRGPQLTRGFPLHRSGRSAPTQSGAGRAPAAGPGLTLAVGLLPVRGDGRRRVLLVLLARSVVLLLHVEPLVALHLPHLKAKHAGSGRGPGVGPGWLPPAPRAGAGRAAQAAPGPGTTPPATERGRAATLPPPRPHLAATPDRDTDTGTSTGPGHRHRDGHGHRDQGGPERRARGRNSRSLTRRPSP